MCQQAMITLIRWFFRRGRVLGMVHEVLFEVWTFLLEDWNIQIDLDNVGIDILDVFLVLVVINNQGFVFLGSRGGHLEKLVGKWYRGNKRVLKGWVGTLGRRVSNDRYHNDQRKRRIEGDRGQIRVSRKGQVYNKNMLKMAGITRIQEKRGYQWDMFQISVLEGPL